MPAPSPFSAPGVQWAWDSTSLGTFKDCPRKYFYTLVMGYRARGESVHRTSAASLRQPHRFHQHLHR